MTPKYGPRGGAIVIRPKRGPGGQRSRIKVPRVFLSSCVSAMAKRAVVVQLGELNRLIHLQLPEYDTRTERELLLSRIRDEFGGRIGSDDDITLQMQSKNEMFKRLFLDYFDNSIEEDSIFKLVLEKKKVCYRNLILKKGNDLLKMFNH